MFTLTFKTDNAAFASEEYSGDRQGDDTPCRIEVARILRKVAGQIETGTTDGVIMDCNGNRVGEFYLELND